MYGEELIDEITKATPQTSSNDRMPIGYRTA
jgi:hypothetical protein